MKTIHSTQQNKSTLTTLADHPSMVAGPRELSQAELGIVSGGLGALEGFSWGAAAGTVSGAVATGTTIGATRAGIIGGALGFSFGMGYGVGSVIADMVYGQ